MAVAPLPARAVFLIAALVAVLVVLGIVVAVCLASQRPPRPQTLANITTIVGTRIPKVIWTYWNSEKISPFLQKCVKTWRLHHPDFLIILLTPATLGFYIDLAPIRVPWNDGPTRESDIVRANVLAAHGGVWSDISIMLFAPCPQLQKVPVGTEFIGFYLDAFTTNPKSPVLENWWFATAPGGDFIVQWRNAFMTLHCTLSIAERVRIIQAEGVDLQKIHASLKQYLFMHVAAQYVLQKGGPSVQTGMNLSKADEGPLQYLCKNAWNSEKAVKWVARQKQKPPMIKLRALERKYAEQLL